MVSNLRGVGNELKMPLLDVNDGRRLTWDKLTNDLASKISRTNAPASTNDCWFYPGRRSDTAGYPARKIWHRGERNKWALHRILFFMKNPTLLPPAGTTTNHEVSHLCGRGRFNFDKGIEVSCINPYHAVWETSDENKDRNLCRRACATWCPHAIKCIWTTEAGEPYGCRNAVPLVSPCVCGKKCFAVML